MSHLEDEENERRLDSEDAKKTKMPNTDVRHPLKYYKSATAFGPKYSS